jgi:hypothetical protein
MFTLKVTYHDGRVFESEWNACIGMDDYFWEYQKLEFFHDGVPVAVLHFCPEDFAKPHKPGEQMTAHQLARILRASPDLPVSYPDHASGCLDYVPIDEVHAMEDVVLVK